MGLFNRVREAYKRSEKRRAITLVNTEYMGGYANKKKALGNLSFQDEQIEFKVALNNRASFVISTKDITDLIVEGKDDVSRRVTVMRLVAVGIFAFALQKKHQDKESFITLELKDSQEVIFHIKDKSPIELKLIVSKTALAIKQSQQS